MRVRALDDDHDWTFGKGQNNYFRDQKALIQNVNTRLASFLGDCYFDVGAGLDWFNYLGAKDQSVLRLGISAIILNTQDVTGLLQLAFVVTNGRRLTVRYRVQSTYSSPAGEFTMQLPQTVS